MEFMKRIFIIMSLYFILSAPAFAQIRAADERQPDGEIISRPICSKLINRSGQTIMGTLSTQKQALADGTMAAHQDNFKLASGAEKEFCVAGPFFEGRRVEVILRTVIPLFDCRTKIDKPIYLDAKPDANGIKRLSATCS